MTTKTKRERVQCSIHGVWYEVPNDCRACRKVEEAEVAATVHSETSRLLAARGLKVKGYEIEEPARQQKTTRPETCGVCQRPWVGGRCSGGFINHKLDGQV